MTEISAPPAGTPYEDPEGERVVQISYVDQPWEASESTPVPAGIDYLRQHTERLDIDPAMLEQAHESLSFTEPREQGVQFRLGQQKDLLDSATVIFNQTYLNVPVWRAAITLTLKLNPIRVVLVTDTTSRGMDAPLPAAKRIEAHRTVFAQSAANQHLASLGLADKNPTVGLVGESATESATAGFLRSVLGRDAAVGESGEGAIDDGADAIRGRFFVYRYRAAERFPASPETDAVGDGGEVLDEDSAAEPEGHVHGPLPTLDLPPVDPAIAEGSWRLVSEVTFALTTPDCGALNWRALIDVETDSVLLLEPLVSGLNGLVFARDPITSTGNASLTADKSNAILNPHRNSVALANLDSPVSGTQSLRGRFVNVMVIDPPNISPPTRPASTDFDYDVRTNDFAGVNAYYHCDRFFALVEDLGFPVQSYFDNTTFPVTIYHRHLLGSSNGLTINAMCDGNGRGGIGFAAYALNDLTDTGNPIGRACDSRVHLHELGGHGILWDHVDHPNFGFAHSAGDSLSAILHDPDSAATDRFRYAPWNPQNLRRFDRSVTDGWAWGGAKDRSGPTRAELGYQREQILCTTLFRAYLAIGGDSTDLAQRRFASRAMIYLVLRAVSTLTPASNPQTAVEFANALMAADLLDWTSERIAGGAYNKVIRWAFEKQGLYQPPGAPVPVTAPGAPPDVDVYIDDGRKGEYEYQPVYWENSSIWNRLRPDDGSDHQDAVAGMPNFAYVALRNRGIGPAQNVTVKAYRRAPGGGDQWPLDFEPLQTAELAAGTIAPNGTEVKRVGPFSWLPRADSSGLDSLVMVASADGDRSNVTHFGVGETIAEARLVPHDNNIGVRRLKVATPQAGPIRSFVFRTLLRMLGPIPPA